MLNPTLVATRFVSPQIKGAGDCDKLETLLSSLDGVRDVSTNPDDHSVTVTYSADIVDRNGMMAALQREGYSIESASDVPPPPEATSSNAL